MNRDIGKYRGKVRQEKDELFEQSYLLSKELGKISESMLQRRFKIGYSRATRILEQIRNKDKKWVYGYYIGITLENTHDKHSIISLNNAIEYEIVPETVCEKTIFKVDDEELYEKDIIKFKDEDRIERIGEVYLSTYETDIRGIGCWGVKYKKSSKEHGIYETSVAICDILDCATKIIGNTIDNPELLKITK